MNLTKDAPMAISINLQDKSPTLLENCIRCTRCMQRMPHNNEVVLKYIDPGYYVTPVKYNESTR